jgi:hypothetical protein
MKVLLIPDIDQNYAYMCKLLELPPGTSQRHSSLCATQRKYKVIGYSNNIQKTFSFSEKLLRKTHNCEICFSAKIPKNIFLRETNVL